VVVQGGITCAGYGGGIYFGFSRDDGFGLGVYGQGGLDLAKWNIGASANAASGYFNWENYSKWGYTNQLGLGPVSYAYSSNGNNQYQMHGFGFGIGSPMYFKNVKTLKNINASSSKNFTIPIIK